MPTDPDEAFAGVPDAFGRLWTPHRMAYIKGESRPSGPGADEDCPFDRAPKLSDEDGLIVARGSLVYVVLNRYPYNAGHLLVVPYRHVADYTDLTVEETAEFASCTQHAIRALRQASGPHGFNIGINLGSVAGAGIAAHLHQHVVPRWGGDTNFMPVVGHTRVLPQLLADTRKLLADVWLAVLAVLARGDDPPEPPGALRAPMRYHAVPSRGWEGQRPSAGRAISELRSSLPAVAFSPLLVTRRSL